MLVGNSPSINICMSTSPAAIFVCRLVFISLFVLIFFLICISTSDSVRLSIVANLCLIFDLYY